MLHRATPEGTVVLGQPAHAWVAGRLAHAWAEPFEPREEVCLAADQHDVGWTAWELAPELDTATGLPYTFSALPPARRLALWARAGELVLPQSRYAALLVSLHGTLLVERFPPQGDEELQRAVAGYLECEGAFQARMLESLRADPHYAPHATAETVARNRELVFAWDWLSLALLHGVTEGRRAAGLMLAPADDDPERVAVTPWPFRPEALAVVCEGRVLRGRFA
ncbi:MAG: DUF3891 family protein, partial [Gaiellaceae bacterium]